jgi:regulator of protease activity HflC (stomatin/prohibitin superfamily)
MTMLFSIGPLVPVVLVAAAISVRVRREYERAVVCRLGRLLPVKVPDSSSCCPG